MSLLVLREIQLCMTMPRTISSFLCRLSMFFEAGDRKMCASISNKLLPADNNPSFAATSTVCGYHFFCESSNSMNSTFPAALVTVSATPSSVADEGKAVGSSSHGLFAATALTGGCHYVIVNLTGFFCKPVPSVNRKNKSERIVQEKPGCPLQQ